MGGFRAQDFESVFNLAEFLRLDHVANLAITTIVLFFFNGWILDYRLLQRDTRTESWLRLCRYVLSGVPLLGVYILPAWRWLIKRRRNRNAINSKPLTAPRQILRLPEFAQAPQIFYLFNLGFNIFVASSWLAYLSNEIDIWRIQLALETTAVISIQLDIFASRRFHCISLRRALVLRLLSVFWFCPWPWCGVGGVGYSFLIGYHQGSTLRMRTFFRGRFGAQEAASSSPGLYWKLNPLSPIQQFLEDKESIASEGVTSKHNDRIAKILSREICSYLYLYLIGHLSDGGNHAKMFYQLNETTFLKEQMAYFDGFEKSSENIERYVVPAAIANNDWNLFIHFMLLAINIRGMAEDLLDVLKPLAASGQIATVKEIVNRTAGPLERSVAKAVIAGTLDPGSALFQEFTQGIGHDLATLPQVADTAIAEKAIEKQFWGVIVVAQEIGLPAVDALAGILREHPEWNDAIWGSMAECHAKRRGILDPDFWEALRHISNLDLLKFYLPEVLASEVDIAHSEDLLVLIDGLSQDQQFRWLCRFSLLVALARTSVKQALALWKHWSTESLIPWSIEIADRGGPFLRTLADHQVRAIVEHIPDSEVQVALCIASITPQRDPQILVLTQELIGLLPQGPTQIHWRLRLVAADQSLSDSDVRREMQTLSRSLRDSGYAVDLGDIRRFAEQIANRFPLELENDLVPILQKIGPDNLFQIIEDTNETSLLACLFENSEDFILAFQPAELDIALIRQEILSRIAPRLCASTEDISYLQRAVKLIPEQADDLRKRTVDKLIDANHLDLAGSVSHSIASRRLRHLTALKLRTQNSATSNLPDPGSLFESLSTDEWIQDEIIGLRALLDSVDTPGSPAHAYVGSMQGKQSQYLVLFRLAWRHLNRPRTKSSPRNDGEVLDWIVQAASSVESDSQLAGMTPEIADLMASRSGWRAIQEIREAIERLLSLRTISWSFRREVCEALLSRLLPLLSAHATKGPFRVGSIEVARMIGDLLEQVAEESDPEIEERGLIPVLFAVMDRMPVSVLKYFLRHSRHDGLLRLYRADNRLLTGVLDELSRQDKPDPVIFETVFYLLSDRYPEIVPDFLDMLSPGLFRDRMASALLRYGWLPAELAPQVLSLIRDPAIRLRTEVTLGLSLQQGSQDEVWLRSLASISLLDLVDTEDPRNEPWIHKLWTIAPEKSRPILAWAALKALAEGGRWYGLSALTLWLHAHLAPDAGNDPARLLALCAQAEQAVQRAGDRLNKYLKEVSSRSEQYIDSRETDLALRRFLLAP
jgi:hypothetical protein